MVRKPLLKKILSSSYLSAQSKRKAMAKKPKKTKMSKK